MPDFELFDHLLKDEVHACELSVPDVVIKYDIAFLEDGTVESYEHHWV